MDSVTITDFGKKSYAGVPLVCMKDYFKELHKRVKEYEAEFAKGKKGSEHNSQ